MKNLKVLRLILLTASLWFGHSAEAAQCGIGKAKITSVFQWTDGSIFVALDQTTSCNCPESARLAFSKNDNEKFLMAAALTAYLNKQAVFAYGDDTSCPIHGNTARLQAIGLIPD